MIPTIQLTLDIIHCSLTQYKLAGALLVDNNINYNRYCYGGFLTAECIICGGRALLSSIYNHKCCFVGKTFPFIRTSIKQLNGLTNTPYATDYNIKQLLF